MPRFSGFCLAANAAHTFSWCTRCLRYHCDTCFDSMACRVCLYTINRHDVLYCRGCLSHVHASSSSCVSACSSCGSYYCTACTTASPGRNGSTVHICPSCRQSGISTCPSCFSLIQGMCSRCSISTVLPKGVGVIKSSSFSEYPRGLPFERLFGLELEVCSVGINLNRFVPSAGWSNVHDGSLRHGGREFLSPPMQGDKAVASISDMCTRLAKPEVGLSRVDDCAGMHIHINTKDYSVRELIKYTVLFHRLQALLYALSTPNRRASHYCLPIGTDYVRRIAGCISRSELMSVIYGRSDARVNGSRQKYHTSRYNALNIHSWFYRGTLENRIHHGTREFEQIYNWVYLNLFMAELAIRLKNNEAVVGESLSVPSAITYLGARKYPEAGIEYLKRTSGCAVSSVA